MAGPARLPGMGTPADVAREAARRPDGRFGEQPHDDPDAVLEPKPRRRGRSLVRRKPTRWEPVTLECADGCGARVELTADQHADLSVELAFAGAVASPDGGRFTSGQFGKAWRCGGCEQRAGDQLALLLSPR